MLRLLAFLVGNFIGFQEGGGVKSSHTPMGGVGTFHTPHGGGVKKKHLRYARIFLSHYKHPPQQFLTPPHS